ncbi:hypothetical protein H6F90_00235 [Trichocoleus sp. FACHB-591]|uniref:hypothetical protein n=1 Tax=Trichocoleus sp. FACHB-591 TaxID=2692872 RepID=UPI001685741C|nr:hypothetical protein [Trichocoleus sp. FACHB-591]MBD2093582.1 hypothetical protein [Trichocoleus sp. FACHB-591]
MSTNFQDELKRVQRKVEDPSIGFEVFGRRFVNPLGNKESNVRDFVTKNELAQFDSDGSLSSKLSNSAPNDWDEIAEDFAGRQAAAEGTRTRAKKEALGDRTREFQDQEAYETRQQARNLASQRTIMDKQLEGQKYGADIGLRGIEAQTGASTRQAQIGADAAVRQAEIGGRYNVQGQEVAGRYALQGQEVMGRYNLEGTKVGARAQVQTAQIGANASRDVANISGNWNYRTTDLTSGRQLQGQREGLASDERRQTQNLLASRQAQGQEYKRQEASELLQARLQRGDSGRNFLLQAVGGKQWFR